ncbi:MAG TPA: extracellular solute-binding protein [Clostridia bacterium]|nr:extracellular solute-binding protein [Clostridia bacterium]
MELKVTYDNSKYGDKWIEDLKSGFESAYSSVKVNAHADGQLSQKILPMLESGKDLPDLLFLSASDWQYMAQKGWLSDLTSLYSETVDSGKTVKQKIKPEYLGYCGYEGKYWVMPWADDVPGLVYNETLFEDNGWTVPKTMNELFELIPKITSKGIAPFAWSGEEISSWDTAVINWWAQYEGLGSIKNYLKMTTPEVYGQRGRLEALKTFEKIIIDTSNSVPDALKISREKAVKLFYEGKAAMMPAGPWIQNLSGLSVPYGFQLKMMAVPAIDGAKQTDIKFVKPGDIAIIPEKAKNKKQAAAFLRYLSTDQALVQFTADTAVPRPFQYPVNTSVGLSDFEQSVMKIWDSGKTVYEYSSNPLYRTRYFDWPSRGEPFYQIVCGSLTAQQAFEENLDYAKKHWSADSKATSK